MTQKEDLTQGTAGTVLIRFTLPLFLSVFFQQLYNIADTAIAGKYIGEDALAAISVSYPITMLFMAVAIGSQIGCGVVLAKLYGSKLYQRVHSCISTAIISGAVISLILTAFGVLASTSLLNLVGTPDNVFADADTYLKIYTGGFLFVHLYNVITGLFSSMGDSKTPLYLLIFSSLGNIVLDLIFVIQWNKGIAGCAWATLIAQAAACVLALYLLYRKKCSLPKNGAAPIFSWRDFGDIVGMSIPSILQQSFISVGNLFIQNFINVFGSSVAAGYGAAIKLNTFALTCFTNMSSGISSFTAQNLGAAKPDRVRQGFRAGILMACGTAIVFSLCYGFFSKPLLRVFANQETSALAMETGKNFLRIVSPFYCIICIKILADGILRGSGSVVYFMIATFVDLVMRVVLAYFLKGPYQATGIWLAWPVSWIIATVLSVSFYRSNVWCKHIHKTESTSQNNS